MRGDRQMGKKGRREGGMERERDKEGRRENTSLLGLRLGLGDKGTMG